MRPPTIETSPATAVLLHLLTPGLGHILWREFSFGIFVFLIVLLGAILFVAALLVTLPPAVEIIMFSLVAVFYLFTFLDLIRTWKRVRATSVPSRTRLIVLGLVGLGFQAFFPLSPTNFAVLNAPQYDRMETNQYAPIVRKDDLIKTSRFAYWVSFFGVSGPILHNTPDRLDLVRYRTDQHGGIGVVLSLPGESVEVVNGTVLINDMPLVSSRARSLVYSGEWPLTRTGDYSMLIAEVNLGRILRLHEVEILGIRGKVTTVF